MISKVKALSRFDLEWWTSQLIPILNEFVETAKGKPKASFWKSIVKTWRPGEMRGRGCIPWGPPPSSLNGWFLKFFPYNRNGRTPDKVRYGQTMLPETVSVPFVYKITGPSDISLGEFPMSMTAGFIGVEEDVKTYALTPKIAWFISREESERDIIKKLKEENKSGGIELTVQEVPDALRHLKHIDNLYINFIGRVNLPDWLDSIKIESFSISGEMTPEIETEIHRRFPDCRIRRS